MPAKYKLWLKTGNKPSRQTLFSRKKRAEELAALKQLNDPPLHNARLPLEEEQVVANEVSDGPVDQPTNLETCVSETPPDTSTDDDVSATVVQTRTKRKRKRKVHTVNHSGSESPSSDESQPSDTASESAEAGSIYYDNPQADVREQIFVQRSVVLSGESSDDCDEDITPDGSARNCEPLCPCTKTTVGDIFVMTLTLGLRHGMSWDAQVDILKMIRTIFGDKKIPLSKATYIKRLNAVKSSDIQYHCYCQTCNMYMGTRQDYERFCSQCGKVYNDDGENEFVDICDGCNIPLEERPLKTGKGKVPCKNENCLEIIDFGAQNNLFVSVSIESQLQRFVRDKKFVDFVTKYRFQRQYIPGVYSDIYDGEMYKHFFEEVEGGVLSSPYNFSYTFFTDGIPYGKSSKQSVWPIYLTINELPYEERRRYFILAGVYCGPVEPDQQWFLKPFVTEANKLSIEGFKWIHNGEQVTSRVFPLCFVADSGARFKFLNMSSYSAYHGCTFCYHLTVGQRYPMDLNKEPAPDRTDKEYRADLAGVLERMHEVQESNRVCRGVKGTCTLDSLKYFSVVSSCTVDYLHCILVGCVKKHMELILMPARKHFWNNMKKRTAMDYLISSIDSVIKKVQSNTSVIRELHLLKDIKHWKASEFRSWLLFYCIVCLKGFLKERHLEHLAFLSRAANLLLRKTVSYAQVNTALQLLKLYMATSQEFFGEEHMYYNTHLLSHIPKVVLLFGPLWGHNSFSYESKNRHILQLCKSPHHVPFQIARKFLIYQSLPHVCSQMVGSKYTITYCEKVLNYKLLARYTRASDNNCVLLGKPKLTALSPSDIEKVSVILPGCTATYSYMYERMYYKRKRYTTANYVGVKKNNDSFAFLNCGQCVKILNISRIPDSNRALIYVEKIFLVKRPVIGLPIGHFDHVKRAIDSNQKFLVSVDKLDRPCFSVKIRNKQYVSSIPYGCTVE